MTQKEQRIAMAMFLYPQFPVIEDAYGRPRHDYGNCTSGPVKDYPRDLNAIHEAEKMLTDFQWPEYRSLLRDVVLGPVRKVSEWCKADLHATSGQKLQALLKVFKLWQEGESE